MSYNTRRTTTGYGTPQQPANAIGQRRPAQTPTNNFNPGGQLSGAQQQKPAMQQQQQQRPQQQQLGGNVRNQAPQQQNYTSQSYSTTPTQVRPQQAQPIKQEPAKPPVQQPPKVVTPKVATPQNTSPIVPGANPPPPEEHDDSMDTSGGTPIKRKYWHKGGRISNVEKVRRRNIKLSKLLQPKNAVMILNELIKGVVFNVEDLPVKVDLNQYRGTVTFNGLEFAGTGPTKIAAKNAAAETALKHLIKNKEICSIKKEARDEDGDEKMDISEEDASNQVMPWSHIASFAVYKLFSTWGEDPNMIGRAGNQENKGGNQNANTGPQKPPKKLPPSPETMNPIMLLHQMLPHAVWEEVGQSGNPPNVVFTFNVTIDDKQFTGTGSSKKTAKKMAAFAACHDILNVNYPPEVYE